MKAGVNASLKMTPPHFVRICALFSLLWAGGAQFPGLAGLLSHGVQEMREATIDLAAYRLSTLADRLAGRCEQKV